MIFKMKKKAIGWNFYPSRIDWIMQSGNCSGGVEKHEQDSCFSDKASFYILKQDYKDKLFQI